MPPNTRAARLDTCQALLVSQINTAITNTADQSNNRMRHDAINHHLRKDGLTSRPVWVQGRTQLSPSQHG